LTAMRVLVDSVKDCYGAIGVIHSLWKPLPGRFKDFVAMPKFNMYQALHTTVIGPEGRPLEIQIRTRQMHEAAEYGIAAHWMYKDGAEIKEDGAGRARGDAKDRIAWIEHLLDWQQDLKDPQDFVEGLKVDLFEDEVFVFTPKGEVKSLPAGSTPLDFAYEIHTDVGHRCVGARVNGKMVPLHYELGSGDICEVLTSKKERRPSSTRSCSGSSRGRRQSSRGPARSCLPTAARRSRSRPPRRGPTGSRSRASMTSRSGSQSAVGPCPATRSSATYPSARASRS